MDKKKVAIAAATSSLLAMGLATSPAMADTPENEIEISTSLIKDTIKPRLMEKAFKEKQTKKVHQAKLKEIKAEQKRMDEIERAKIAARKKAAAKIAKAKKELAAKLAKKRAASQAPKAKKTTTKTVNKGQFKLSFYDPAAMGSSMGYSGVAANLSVFPRGTRLKITLSDGTVWHRVVNDTGSFAQSNPRQLDVAMPNDQVPSAGILYATVEVEQ